MHQSWFCIEMHLSGFNIQSTPCTMMMMSTESKNHGASFVGCEHANLRWHYHCMKQIKKMTLKSIEVLSYNRISERLVTLPSHKFCDVFVSVYMMHTNPLWLYLTLSMVSDKSHAHRIKCHLKEQRTKAKPNCVTWWEEKSLKLHYCHTTCIRCSA